MTVYKRNTGEGGTAGAVTATAATALPDRFSFLAGDTSVITLDAAAAFHGSLGYKIAHQSGKARALAWSGNSTSSQAAFRYYTKWSATPPTPSFLLGVIVGSVTGLGLYLGADGRPFVQSAAGTLSTSPTALAVDTWYRVEAAISVGTSTTTGQVKAAVYAGDSTTAIWSYDSGATTNAGYASGTVVASVQYGKMSGSTWAAEQFFDDLAMDVDTVALIGPPPSNVAPTVNAGVDQTVDSYAAVTLTATASDSDGTIASYAWAQTAGPAVTLAGTGASRAFKAPGVATDTALTFQVTATDNAGATATDTIVVTVREATTRVWSGAAWAPAEILRWDGGAWV